MTNEIVATSLSKDFESIKKVDDNVDNHFTDISKMVKIGLDKRVNNR